MKIGSLCGYIGIIQAIGYGLLQKYNLLDFAPVLDNILQVVCPVAGVAGGVALHMATPPGSDA